MGATEYSTGTLLPSMRRKLSQRNSPGTSRGHLSPVCSTARAAGRASSLPTSLPWNVPTGAGRQGDHGTATGAVQAEDTVLGCSQNQFLMALNRLQFTGANLDALFHLVIQAGVLKGYGRLGGQHVKQRGPIRVEGIWDELMFQIHDPGHAALEQNGHAQDASRRFA